MRTFNLLDPAARLLRIFIPRALLLFNPGDLKDDWIVGIRAAEMTDSLFFLPGDVASKSESGDEGKQGMKCPVAEFGWGKMFENEFVSYFQIKRTFPFFQDFYDLNFDLVGFQMIK